MVTIFVTVSLAPLLPLFKCPTLDLRHNHQDTMSGPVPADTTTRKWAGLLADMDEW